MRCFFQTENGLAGLDPDHDIMIYEAPCNPPNTGTRYLRGTDLLLHVTKKGHKVFYFLKWSIWQSEEDVIEVINEDQAREFFIECTQSSGWDCPDEDEIEKFEKYLGPLEETA